MGCTIGDPGIRERMVPNGDPMGMAIRMTQTHPLLAALRRLARSTEPVARYNRFFNRLSEIFPENTSANHAKPQDNWLTALVLLEDCLQCQPHPWISTVLDARLQAAGRHHGLLVGQLVLQQNKLPIAAYQAALEALGLRTHWLQQAQTPLGKSFSQAFACVLALYLPHPSNLIAPLSWGAWFETPSLFPSHEVLPSALRHWRTCYSAFQRLPAIETCTLQEVFQVLQPCFNTTVVNPTFTAADWPRPHWGIIGVEGMSECHVVPAAARALGLPLEGTMVVATGGKSPMVGWAQQTRTAFSGCMALLLDGDGADEATQIAPLLHKDDVVCCLPGTLEDDYPDSTVVRAINEKYDPVTLLTVKELADFRQKIQLEMGMSVDNLALFKALWEFYELTPPEKPGPFDKVSFAAHIATLMTVPGDVPPALAQCLTEAAANIEAHRQEMLAALAAAGKG